MGLFGRSMDCADRDDRHPAFHVYASGPLAYEHAPDEIHNHRELSLLRRLAELADGSLA